MNATDAPLDIGRLEITRLPGTYLSRDDARQEIISISDSDGNDDGESLDSTNSALLRKVSHHDVMKIACYHWSNDISFNIKSMEFTCEDSKPSSVTRKVC